MVNIVKLRETDKGFEEVFQAIRTILRLYPKVFKNTLHRIGSIKMAIQKGHVVFQDGVFITFQQNSVRHKVSHTADVYCKPLDVTIHQIGTDHSIKGATKKVLDKFVEWCKLKSTPNIWLTVRQDNDRACNFYDRYGFIRESECYWNSKEEGKVKGYIYKLKLENKNASKFFKL